MTNKIDKRFLAALTLLAFAAVFIELGRMPVYTANEGQRAVPPIEMIESGNYLIPTIDNVDYLVKPPLLYWCIAGVYQASGCINEWTARIPTAVAGAMLVVLIYLMGTGLAGEGPARWAALAMLVSPYFLERARWANLDVPLTFAMFVSLALLWKGLAADCPRHRAGMSIYAGLALGVALMFKGPPALLFIVAAAFAYLVVSSADTGRILRSGLVWTGAMLVLALVLLGLRLAAFRYPTVQPFSIDFPLPLVGFVLGWSYLVMRYGSRDAWRRVLPVCATTLALAVAVAAPWAFSVLAVKGWPYVRDLLQNQVVERTYSASRINSGSPLFYVINLLAMAAPASLLLPFHFSKRFWETSSPFYRFCVLTGWLSVAAFSVIAGKEREYVMPAVPLLLLATGYHLHAYCEGGLSGWLRKWTSVWSWAWTILLPLVAVGGAIYLGFAAGSWTLGIEAALLALMAVGAVLVYLKSDAHRIKGVFFAALAVVLMALIGRSFDYRMDKKQSFKYFGQACRALIDEGYTVETSPRLGDPRQPFRFPQLLFYVREEIPMEDDPARIAEKLKGDRPYYYFNEMQLLQRWSSMLVEADFQTLLGPQTRKDLVLIGNQRLPDLPAVDAARSADLTE